jgi:DNA ligase-4
MIVYYDILLLNNKSLLCEKRIDRLRILNETITCLPGLSQLCERTLLSFDKPAAVPELRSLFARCIANSEEGLVIKPADEAYFGFHFTQGYSNCCIKLKKEYIGNFGDVGDFAAIAASYDPVRAKEYRLPNIRFTDFYVGCLENKEDAVCRGDKPRFVVVAHVPVARELMRSVVQLPPRYESTPSSLFEMRLERGIANGQQPTVYFNEPLVFDMHCFAFDKQGDTGFWTMRFPRVTKIHSDRTVYDTISFQQLQDMAQLSRFDPQKDQSTDDIEWMKRLNGLEPLAGDNESTQRSNESVPSIIPTPGEVSSGHSNDSVHTECAVIHTRRASSTVSPIQDAENVTIRKASMASISRIQFNFAEASDITEEILQGAEAGDAENCPLEVSSTQRRKRRRLSSEVLSVITNEAWRNSSLDCRATKILSLDDQPRRDSANVAHQRTTLSGSKEPLVASRGSTTVNDIRTVTRGMPSASAVSVIYDMGSSRRKVPIDSAVTPLSASCEYASDRCMLQKCYIAVVASSKRPTAVQKLILRSHGGRALPFTICPVQGILSVPRGHSHCPKRLVFAHREDMDEIRGVIKLSNYQAAENGFRDRSWLEVYDWRLLDYVTADKICDRIGHDTWRRYWLGTTGVLVPDI